MELHEKFLEDKCKTPVMLNIPDLSMVSSSLNISIRMIEKSSGKINVWLIDYNGALSFSRTHFLNEFFQKNITSKCFIRNFHMLSIAYQNLTYYHGYLISKQPSVFRGKKPWFWSISLKDSLTKVLMWHAPPGRKNLGNTTFRHMPFRHMAICHSRFAICRFAVHKPVCHMPIHHTTRVRFTRTCVCRLG